MAGRISQSPIPSRERWKYGLFVWALDDVNGWVTARQVEAPEEAGLAEGAITTSRGYLAFGNGGGVTPEVEYGALVERPDGYLAVGWPLAHDGCSVAAAWRSVDGLSWEAPDVLSC